jgi:hypothetical protein
LDTATTPSLDTASRFSAFTSAVPSSESDRGTYSPGAPAWPLWQKVLFRFFFVYLILQIEPWNWFRIIPGLGWIFGQYSRLQYKAVVAANAAFFHVRDTLVSPNGSGDTSYMYAHLLLCLSVAAVACVAWSVLDRKRPHYDRLAFWLRMSVRYYIAAAALSYGVIKLFALQMSFPTLSQLSTPLGDLLPMRFSWLFIGYSVPYQFFSGCMETVAGLLLLYRRTVTAGLFAATGAFMNVVMINMAYDVPVKLYASHLLLACIFLLALDSKRLLNFLVLNRVTPPTAAWEPKFSLPWQRWGAAGVKLLLLYQLLYVPSMRAWTGYKANKRPVVGLPFKAGVYEVKRYVVNRDSVPLSAGDSLRWRDVIIDNNAAGSVNTKDPVFWQRYGRGYFRYKADLPKHTLAVWKISTAPGDSTFLFTMRYEMPDTNTIRFHTVIRGDSIHVDLARTGRHFQLAERQFHWISEYNR